MPMHNSITPSAGINLIDVAEMYPVPPRPETQGLTETYVGNWLAKRGNREKLVIASKVSGPHVITMPDPPKPDPRS